AAPSGPGLATGARVTLSPPFAIICPSNSRPSSGRPTNRRTIGEGSEFVHWPSRMCSADLIFDRTIPMNLEDHCTMSGSGSPAASLAGRFLVAAPSMPDERFQKSVVFICKHDDDGALGIIVNNKVEDLPLGQVYRQLGIDVPATAAERPVLFGGPVETSRGLVLHSADYKREETLLIEGGMALTASLEILKDMAGGNGPRQAWLALGHSGWTPG